MRCSGICARNTQELRLDSLSTAVRGERGDEESRVNFLRCWVLRRPAAYSCLFSFLLNYATSRVVQHCRPCCGRDYRPPRVRRGRGAAPRPHPRTRRTPAASAAEASVSTGDRQVQPATITQALSKDLHHNAEYQTAPHQFSTGDSLRTSEYTTIVPPPFSHQVFLQATEERQRAACRITWYVSMRSLRFV